MHHEQAQQILESITDGLVTLDPQWRYTYINDQAEQALGRPRADLLGKCVWEEFPLVVGTEAERQLRRAATERVPSGFELYDQARAVWYENRVFPTPDGGVAIYFRNVTERKRAEESLRASEERVRHLVALMPAAVCTCDAEGRITFCNRRAIELWGRQPQLGTEGEKYCGSFRLWRADGAQLRHDESPMASAVREGQPARNLEVVIEQPEGDRVVVSVNIDPLHDAEGRRVGAINVFEDITDRKRAEEHLRRAHNEMEMHVHQRTAELAQANVTLRAEVEQRRRAEVSLRESEEKYRLLFSSETDAILLFDQQTGIVLEANDAAVGVYGYQRDAFPPIAALETADGPSLVGSVTAMFRDGGTTGLAVRRHRRNGGAVFPAEIAAGRFTWQGRTVVCAVVRDIGERLQTQEREQQLRAELARVGRLSLTSAIASGLAHELNQPLTAILTYTDACLRLVRSPASDPSDVQEALERIAIQARRASDVVRGTRNFVARPELARSRVAVRALLDEVLQLDEFELRAKNIRVALAGPPERVDVFADRVQIVQVLLNLIRNAVDAMETTAPDDRDLTIRAVQTAHGEVVIALRDRGCGLPPHIRERMGQPFQTTKPHGTGLGLAISWTIVEGHGGRLWAEFNEDGTTFYFTLPLFVEGIGEQ